MALPVREQVKYWSIAAAVFLLFLWALGDVVLPFVLGGAVAYFLDPVADRLERLGLSRAAATTVITLVAVLLFVLALLLLVPALARQTTALIDTAPQLFKQLQAFLVERFPDLMDENSTLRSSLADLGETIRQRGGEFVDAILGTFSSVLNVVLLVVIVPVVAFYLLLDWDRMVAEIDKLLPRDHAPTIRRLASEIDTTLAGFVRGQGTVCLILGTYYAVALMLVGLQFGLVIGLVAGLLTFIPYVGALIGGLLSIGLALFQFWGDWWTILLVAAIFQVGQMVEGNVLTPKLVGGSVGLHPVWLIFALSAFGALFGFVGLLVAVPVAAALGVLARFAIRQYQESLLYRGLSGRPGPGPGQDGGAE
jgi:predicted PurR-regulated permease PerM